MEVEDAPFLVKSLDYNPSAEAKGAYFAILLNDESTETLNLSTLQVGEDNVLYCRVKKGGYRARFCRASYYELARYIEFDPSSGSYFVLLNGERYYLKGSDKTSKFQTEIVNCKLQMIVLHFSNHILRDAPLLEKIRIIRETCPELVEGFVVHISMTNCDLEKKC